MKQLLFLLFSILIGLNTLQAKQKHFKEKTQEEITWNIISERFFNGDNSKVYRFEEDIEFKLSGEATAQDSAILNEIIVELNELLETVDIKYAENYGNFSISLLTVNHRINQTPMMHYTRGKINTVKLEIIVENIPNLKERKRYYYYYIIRNLVKINEPSPRRTDYHGIFEANTFPVFTKLSEIDKDILRKLYSENFYKDLRTNIVLNNGYLYYLNLKYNGWVKTISTLISILIIILGFLYLLSKETNSKSNLTFWNYIKRGCIILLWLSIAYWFYGLAYFIPMFEFVKFFYSFLATFAEIFSFGIFALILMYYSDRLFLSKFTNFFQKQFFVFVSTTFLILLCYAIISLPFVYLNSRHSSDPPNFTKHINLSIIFNILIFSGLHIFYNFIKYRVHGLVNQKDVELAKMKELKNQAELNALHSRINPHFLYNSLNSIASLAHINPDKTENMATALSELFRYSINKEDKTFVTVEEELEMVQKYLEIEKTRFEDKLEYKIEAEENVKEKLIPKFLIQPLAENAIKHGLSKIKEVGKIIVEVKQLENNLVITIFDNGPDFPEEPVSGYGLQNLNDKLEILYGKDAYINWENGDSKHFKITIKNQFKDEANL